MPEVVDEQVREEGAPEVAAALDGAAPAGQEDPVETLRREVGRLVLDHPGVLRLEPTLLGAVQGLRRPSSLDGARLTARGRVVDLDLSLATRSDHQARAAV